MASRKQIIDMKIPIRTAPPPPVAAKKPSETSWRDELFANDPFASSNDIMQKKKPPPRPPPPKVIYENKTSIALVSKPNVPQRPAHFNRKPTILSSLMSRKPKQVPPTNDFQAHVVLPAPRSASTNNVQSLIDFSSPPSSPTLTTRSSSDGLSVDSFGSDITSSTANGNTHINGGNTSQAESGFEDDFDLFNNRPDSETPQDSSWVTFDPFSPPKSAQKPRVNRPMYDSDFLDPLCNGKTVKSNVQTHKIPTIIRAKPARPKAPKNSALLSNSLMNAKFTNGNAFCKKTPVQIEDKYAQSSEIFEEGNYSPPMPSVPPPPPPPLLEACSDAVDMPYSREWTPDNDIPIPVQPSVDSVSLGLEPYGVALYDFPGTHQDDLPFRVNDKIRLLRKLDNEWMYGKLRCGMEGMFPINYIDIQIPIPEEKAQEVLPVPVKPVPEVTAMYDFVPQEQGDLGFSVGCKIRVLSKVNEEWLFGEIGNIRGQFPSNYVDHIPADLPIKQ